MKESGVRWQEVENHLLSQKNVDRLFHHAKKCYAEKQVMEGDMELKKVCFACS